MHSNPPTNEAVPRNGFNGVGGGGETASGRAREVFCSRRPGRRSVSRTQRLEISLAWKIDAGVKSVLLGIKAHGVIFSKGRGESPLISASVAREVRFSPTPPTLGTSFALRPDDNGDRLLVSHLPLRHDEYTTNEADQGPPSWCRRGMTVPPPSGGPGSLSYLRRQESWPTIDHPTAWIPPVFFEWRTAAKEGADCIRFAEARVPPWHPRLKPGSECTASTRNQYYFSPPPALIISDGGKAQRNWTWAKGCGVARVGHGEGLYFRTDFSDGQPFCGSGSLNGQGPRAEYAPTPIHPDESKLRHEAGARLVRPHSMPASEFLEKSQRMTTALQRISTTPSVRSSVVAGCKSLEPVNKSPSAADASA